MIKLRGNISVCRITYVSADICSGRGVNETPKPENTLPQTLHEAIIFFAAGDNALDYMVALRWPNGVKCPNCESKDVRFLKSRKIWECDNCTIKRQFSVKVGTIFEASP